MRNWINLCEDFGDFGKTETLFHGTNIDNLWLIFKEGKLTIDTHGWFHDGPEGICLTRSFRVAYNSGFTHSENLRESFFEYFGLKEPPEDILSPVIFEFERSKITNKIIPYDDLGGEEEEEERVVGDLELHSLKHIWLHKPDIHAFLYYARIVKKTHRDSEYGIEFIKIMETILKDSRLKPLR